MALKRSISSINDTVTTCSVRNVRNVVSAPLSIIVFISPRLSCTKVYIFTHAFLSCPILPISCSSIVRNYFVRFSPCSSIKSTNNLRYGSLIGWIFVFSYKRTNNLFSFGFKIMSFGGVIWVFPSWSTLPLPFSSLNTFGFTTSLPPSTCSDLIFSFLPRCPNYPFPIVRMLKDFSKSLTKYVYVCPPTPWLAA